MSVYLTLQTGQYFDLLTNAGVDLKVTLTRTFLEPVVTGHAYAAIILFETSSFSSSHKVSIGDSLEMAGGTIYITTIEDGQLVFTVSSVKSITGGTGTTYHKADNVYVDDSTGDDTGDDTGNGDTGDTGDSDTDKGYLPYIILGILLLFLFSLFGGGS